MPGKVVIVVDAYSTGRLVPLVLKQREQAIIHVHSCRQPDDLLASLGVSDPSLFDRDIVHEGNIPDSISKLKAAAGDRMISAVICGCESGVELTDALSEALQLPTTNGTQFSQAKRNKYEMRKAVSAAGLATPSFFECTDMDSMKRWMGSNITYPVVLKPLCSGGSDCVLICRNDAQAAHAIATIKGQTDIFDRPNNKFLAEQFIEGEEFVVNSVSCKGKHKTVDVRVYTKTHLPDRGIIYDTETLVDPNSPNAIVATRYVHKVLDALQIQYGASHAEVMIMPDGQPMLVEIAARLGGTTNIAVSRKCLGYDSVNLVVDSYLQPDTFLQHYATPFPLKEHSTTVFVATNETGTLHSEKFSTWKKPETVTVMKLNVHPGCNIEPTKDYLSSPATFILVGTESEIARDYLKILTFSKTALSVIPSARNLANASICCSKDGAAALNIVANRGQQQAKSERDLEETTGSNSPR